MLVKQSSEEWEYYKDARDRVKLFFEENGACVSRS